MQSTEDTNEEAMGEMYDFLVDSLFFYPLSGCSRNCEIPTSQGVGQLMPFIEHIFSSLFTLGKLSQ